MQGVSRPERAMSGVKTARFLKWHYRDQTRTQESGENKTLKSYCEGTQSFLLKIRSVNGKERVHLLTKPSNKQKMKKVKQQTAARNQYYLARILNKGIRTESATLR